MSNDPDFAALWSSDGVTRSFAPTATGVPADLPFLFAAGDRFGPYAIVRPLGKGGMGQVYEAEEIESGRRLALKLLSRGLGDDEERERFLREGRLAASLSHPNCVYVFGTTEIQGFPVIAMELVPEGTLKDRVTADSEMSASNAVDAVLQVVAGLEAAATIGILHRDVKPSNCFVHREGRVLVGDFGLSVDATGHESVGSAAATILGTPGFASPEQLRGDVLDVRSDIYSVGATLFYLLAGRAPFDDGTTSGLVSKVESEPAPSLISLRPEMPRRLSLAIGKCLSKKREDRFPDYAALRAALEPFGSARLTPAPIVRRALAGWIDSAVPGAAVLIATLYLNLLPLSSSRPGDAAVVGMVAAVAAAGYYGILEGLWGAALGKAIFGLRVVDASQTAPGIRRATARALAFALASQLIARTIAWLAMRQAPDISISLLNTMMAAASLIVLFCTARPSNGYLGLHDRLTRTRVVKRRVRTEGRDSVDRVRSDERASFEGDAHIGPYRIPSGVSLPVAAAASVVGFDDRLNRRVRIELLPQGTPPLNPLRRDLDRPARARWLGGKRNGPECWDAYEAFDGRPLEDAAASPVRWSRVRHWLSDLSHELAAGLSDGTLPPLDPGCVWIGHDDRARIVEETRRDAAPDLKSTQGFLYCVAAGALLGVPPRDALDVLPRTPLPLPARKTLLALRASTYTSAGAMLDGMSTALATPAIFSRRRRATQIAAGALLPLGLTAVTIGTLVTKGERGSLSQFSTWSGLWVAGLAVLAGTFVITIGLSLAGALVTGSGFTFRPCGAALVNRRGERASRARALLRSAVTWLPVMATFYVFSISPRAPDYSVPMLLLQTCIMGGMFAAAGWAIARPTRGIQDRIAGTWIVPR